MTKKKKATAKRKRTAPKKAKSSPSMMPLPEERAKTSVKPGFPIVGRSAPARGQAADLRKKAEEKVLANEGKIGKQLSLEEANQLLHELQVHQVELEMQNEELRKSQLAVEELRDQYLDLYDFSPGGYFTFTREARIKEVNLTGASLLGIERNKLIKAGFRRFVMPEGLGKWDRHLISVFEHGEDQSCELQLMREDRSVFYARTDSIRMVDTNGIPVMRTALSNITEYKRAEEKSKRLATVVMDSNDAITIQDFDGQITAWNRGAERMYGYCEKEALQMNVRHLTPLDRAAEQKEQTRQLIAGGTISSFETQRVTKDGRTLTIWMTVTKLTDDSGKPIGIASTERDITSRKLDTEALIRQTEELKRSNEELQQFAYIASHDLQEPLRMIASYLQLIEKRYKDKLDKDADEFIGFATDGAIRLQEMIMGLLAYSQVGTKGNRFEEVNCSEVLGDAISNLKIAIEESGALVTSDGLPVIKADERRLLQVFQNLISNAIKFRGADLPRVHVSAKPIGDEQILDFGMRNLDLNTEENKSETGDFQNLNSKIQNYILFSIQDNGIGIAPEYKDRIFNIFQRLHGREYPGIGIGLSLCRRIVEKHGGKIWFESEAGKGTTFYFTIPKR